jgi:mRNA interferase MazF
MNRGNLVIIDFRSMNPAFGVRPALILQNDKDNARMRNTIVAQVTPNIRRAGEETQYLIDPAHPDWASSGLHKPSVVNCSNIYTVQQNDVAKVIGSLSKGSMQEIHECLKAVFDMA